MKAKKPRAKAGTSKAATELRRKAFADAYIANGRNGTQAAITAGYSVNGADTVAVRLLGDVRVSSLIDEMTAELSAKTGLTTERVLREVERLSFSDMRKFLKSDGTMKPIHELDDDCAAALSSLEIDSHLDGDGEDASRVRTTKFKVWDKNAALEKAMKHLGLYERDNLQRGESLAIQVVLVK